MADRQRYDDEWFYLSTSAYSRIGCCDCGLVHLVRARVLGDGRVMVKMARDERSTRRIRKASRWHRPDAASMPASHLSEMLRQWRTIETISVRNLAADIGISAATLSRIERGYQMDLQSFLKLQTWLLK